MVDKSNVFRDRIVQFWPLCILAVSVLQMLCSMPARSADLSEQAVQSTTVEQIKALQARASRLTPAQRKIDTQLLDAMPAIAAAPGLTVRTVVPQDASGQVELDITANVSPSLLDKIKSLGGAIVYSYPESHAIRARLALGRLADLASEPGVIAIGPARSPQEDGVTATEGDVAHQADVARRLDGADGTGVKVCVLSNTPDTDHGDLDAAYASGALDRALTTIMPGQGGWQNRNPGEGLAMMEIVHSLAPGAAIEFATGRTGAAQMAQNIRNLANSGCQIMVDDEAYSNDPPFQDGDIGQAINEVSRRGIYYFSAAGNDGSVYSGNPSVFEGFFADSGAFTDTSSTRRAGNLDLFAAGKTYETVEKPSHGTSSEDINLFWNDPWYNRANNYDLYVADATGHIYAEATSFGLPIQTINMDYNATHKKLSINDRILVVKESGSDARFIHLDITPTAKFDVSTYGRTRGHNASGAANAFSVGALQVDATAAPFQPNSGVADFSSDGPRRIFFDEAGHPLTPDLGANGGVVLNKPDFLAASHINTTVPGFHPFSGTSAAAPHAAAIAALILSRYPTITPAQMRDILVRSVLPDGDGPWNEHAGAGILMANRAFVEASKVFHPQLFVNSWQNFVLAGGALSDKRGAHIDNYDGHFHWVKAPSLTNVVSVAMGGSKVDAVMKDGTVQEWSRSDNPVPHVVPNLSGIVSVAIGNRDETIAVKSDGTLVGWNGGVPPSGLSGVRAVYSNPDATYWGVIRNDGFAATWAGYDRRVHESVRSLGKFVSLAPGQDFVIGLTVDGRVDVPDGDRSVINTWPDNAGITALAAGGWSTIGLKGTHPRVWYFRRNPCQEACSSAGNLVSINNANSTYFALRSDGSEVMLGHYTQ